MSPLQFILPPGPLGGGGGPLWCGWPPSRSHGRPQAPQRRGVGGPLWFACNMYPGFCAALIAYLVVIITLGFSLSLASRKVDALLYRTNTYRLDA